ncbi:hypothetical protein FPQ18DRAFT_351016 [Pyronema domesticum]|nr:hypothetical protein FPQ18DRAFT_351016 [Pyronema domesticum]
MLSMLLVLLMLCCGPVVLVCRRQLFLALNPLVKFVSHLPSRIRTRSALQTLVIPAPHLVPFQNRRLPLRKEVKEAASITTV